MSVSDSSAWGERRSTTYVAATCGSITDIPAGDRVRGRVERLEVCAGGRTAELHNSILARSQAVADPARVDNDGARDRNDHRFLKPDSTRKETELVAAPPARAGGTRRPS